MCRGQEKGRFEYGGSTVVVLLKQGRAQIDADILENTDKFPTELSCAEASVSAPQSIVANIMAATTVVSYLYNILILGSIEVRSVTFSTKMVYLKPVVPPKRKRRAA